MISPEKQAAYLEQELKAWMHEDVYPTLIQAIKKRERHIPEGTAQALEQDVIRDALGQMPGYTLSFIDPGRIVDMRPSSLDWKKRPIFSNSNFMLEWLKKNPRFVKYIPGYKGGKAPGLSTDKKLERVASAIIAAYPRPGYRRRRRGAWYNRTIQKLVTRLIERLSKNQADYFADHFGKDLKEKAFGGKISL